jgi:lysosomal Pro-X carboxypeptidase
MASQQTDPKWLIEERKKEVKIIKGWIKQYYNDIRTQGQNPLRAGPRPSPSF